MAAPTLVLRGIPDNRMVKCMLVAGQGPQMEFPGCASFLAHVIQDLGPTDIAYLGPGVRIRLREAQRPGRLINYVADPDICRQALEAIAQIQADTGLPCFNEAHAVLRSDRASVSARLAGLEGLVMPRTIRLAPRVPADITAAAREAGLRYPLIARVAGDHNGVSMVLIPDEDTLDPVFTIPWGGRDLYLTEYHDYQDADGLYRKLRLGVVGGRYFPRHLVRGRHWLLHASDRDDAATAEESGFLATFDTAVRPRLDPLIAGMRARLGLDYFGVDCSLRPDGRLLVFEANPCMSLLANTSPSPNMWDEPIRRIREALVDLLKRPGAWASPAHTP